MKKTVFFFGFLSIGLMIILRYGAYSLLRGSPDPEVVLGLVAIVFFFLGAYLYRKSIPSRGNVEMRSATKTRETMGLTSREQQVLLEICRGLSNREIAEKLFVSEHTIKTHVSNLLVKLEVKRRTQAIQVARELNLG